MKKNNERQKELYAFKNREDVLGIDALPPFTIDATISIRPDSTNLFYRNKEDQEYSDYSYDRPFKLWADMLEALGISNKTPIDDLLHVRYQTLLCVDCLYDLHVVRIPFLTVGGADRLERFGIFAFIDDEMLGVMSGYKTCSDDIVGFYCEIANEMEKTVCARSWRYLAERSFPELRNTYAIAEEEISPDLQENILMRLHEFAKEQDVENHPCVLVSRMFVYEDARKCGILEHMLGALDEIYTEKYAGVFYLAPKADSPDREEYDISVSAKIAKSYGMEVVGEERPLAILFRETEAVA